MTSHGICSECDHPLNDGEYFVTNGDGTGIHHECPEEIVAPSFDRDPQEPSKPMSHFCPICSQHIAHDEQAVLNGDDLCHFDCVREVNQDIDDLREDFEIWEEEGCLDAAGFFGDCHD